MIEMCPYYTTDVAGRRRVKRARVPNAIVKNDGTRIERAAGHYAFTLADRPNVHVRTT